MNERTNERNGVHGKSYLASKVVSACWLMVLLILCGRSHIHCLNRLVLPLLSTTSNRGRAIPVCTRRSPACAKHCRHLHSTVCLSAARLAYAHALWMCYTAEGLAPRTHHNGATDASCTGYRRSWDLQMLTRHCFPIIKQDRQEGTNKAQRRSQNRGTDLSGTPLRAECGSGT